MSWSGIFKPKHPEKYIGNVHNIWYRSSWELKFMRYLDANDKVMKWGSEELIIHYFDPVAGKIRRYFPDFYMKVQQSSGKVQEFVVEIKPDGQTVKPKEPKRKNARYNLKCETYITNQAKWEAAEKFCDEKGWKFQIITEKTLFGPNYKY